MRILVCSPGYSGKSGSFYFSSDKKLINGLIRCGHAVAHFRDRDEADAVFNIRQLGRYRARGSFLRLVDQFEPELVLLLHADVISAETLVKLKERLPHCLVVDVDVDAIHTEERRQRHLSKRVGIDRTFVTSGGEWLSFLRKSGIRAAFMPNPTDSSLEAGNSYEAPRKQYDLIYVAGARLESGRWDLIDEVQRQSPGIAVGRFGADKQRIFGRPYLDLLLSTKLALNWSVRNDIQYYSSDRIAQLFGMGVAVCVADSTGYRDFLDESEAVFFRDAQDLALKVGAVTSNERWREIGRRGQKKYRQLFNETRVADYIVKCATGQDLSEFEWADV